MQKRVGWIEWVRRARPGIMEPSSWTSSSPTTGWRRTSWSRLPEQVPWKVAKTELNPFKTDETYLGALSFVPFEMPWATLPPGACEYLTKTGVCLKHFGNTYKIWIVNLSSLQTNTNMILRQIHKQLQTNTSAATERLAPVCFIFPFSLRLSTPPIRE